MKTLITRGSRFLAWLVLGSVGYVFAAAALERRRKKKEDKAWKPLLGTVYPKDLHRFEKEMKYNDQ